MQSLEWVHGWSSVTLLNEQSQMVFPEVGLMKHPWMDCVHPEFAVLAAPLTGSQLA